MAPEPIETGVVIPISDVYREVRDMHLELKEMRADLKPIGDHESRLRSLERKLWLASGFALCGGAGLSQLISTMMGG